MIELTDIFAYCITLGVAVAIPGPGITALVARSVGQGARTGFSILSGIIVGDVIYLSFAVFGLSLVAQHFSLIFTAVRWGAITYLLYLAWQFWTATHVKMNTDAPSKASLRSAAFSGLAITLGNPKTIAFYLALLPLVLDLGLVSFYTYSTILIPLTIAVLVVVGGLYVCAAVVVRRSLSGPRAQRTIHRGASVAMFGAAGAMVFKEI